MRWAAAALGLALVGCASAPPPPPAPRATPVATPLGTPTAAPAPTPPPMPTRVPTAPPPAAMPAHDVEPPLVRVLLTRSASPVTIPQPGRAFRVTADGRSSWLWGPLECRVLSGGSRWWQIGAFADPETIESADARIHLRFGPAIEVQRAPGPDGLVRLRVRWSSGEPTDPAAELEAAGFPGAFAGFGAGVLEVKGADGASVTSGGEILLEPGGDWPVAADGRRYRGRLVARAVGREALLINELNLERYLQGVVPAEMGPSQFPELDALKAQAVAARTYTVAHLSDHADEGWDLCDTPACQVYKGVDVEHRLSNRAIEETAGLIAAFGGEPIDAMYTSTCGGHTDDVTLLFPGREKPYLKGVRCAWDRPMTLAGSTPGGQWLSSTAFSAEVALEVLALEEPVAPREIVEMVQLRTGLSRAIPDLASPDAYCDSLLEAVGVDPPTGIAPPTSGLQRLLFLTDLYLIPLDPPTAGLTGPWPAAAALAALELRGEVRRDRGEAVPRPNGAGIFPRRADHGEDLPSPLPLWERWAGGYRRLEGTEVLPGTRLERLRLGETVVALVVGRSGGDAEADRRSAWREWVREKTWNELEQLLGVAGLERLTVTARSPSGRVVGFKAVGAGGNAKEWSGFDVRRALGLPETLFNMHLRTDPDGGRVVRFLGRGWGHGVGLCQNGAYGLARSGMEFEAILKHYYSGIAVERWSAAPAASK